MTSSLVQLDCGMKVRGQRFYAYRESRVSVLATCLATCERLGERVSRINKTSEARCRPLPTSLFRRRMFAFARRREKESSVGGLLISLFFNLESGARRVRKSPHVDSPTSAAFPSLPSAQATDPLLSSLKHSSTLSVESFSLSAWEKPPTAVASLKQTTRTATALPSKQRQRVGVRST